MKRIVGSSLLASCLSLALGAAACGTTPSETDVPTYEEYKAQLPYDVERKAYIVEGDMVIDNEQTLHGLYDRYFGSQAQVSSGEGTVQQGLTVKQIAHVDDIWPVLKASELTYCVSQLSFGTDYNGIVAALDAAAASWEDAAGVNFVHVTSADGSCGNASNVVFNVQEVPFAGYTANSPFPDTVDRTLNVNAAAFHSTVTLAGIMRHELGHVLGFLHEGQQQAGVPCNTNVDWRAVTAYDPSSAMASLTCLNFNEPILSTLDKSGAASLYPKDTFKSLPQPYVNLNFGLPSTWQVATGDFNGDGKTDYARLGDTGAFIYWGIADGSFSQGFQPYSSPIVGFGTPSTWEPVSGDFDHDGRADYMRVGATGAWTFSGPTTGYTFVQAPFWPYKDASNNQLDFGQPSTWTTITGDFNGDGKIDHARVGGTAVWTFLSTSRGQFGAGVPTTFPGLDFGQPSTWETLTGDFNNDGKTDFIRVGATGVWSYIASSSGNGTFVQSFWPFPATEPNFGQPSTWTTLAGDFNGDGKMDFIRLGATESRMFWSQGVSNNQLTFTAKHQNYDSTLNFGQPSTWTSLVGDFNGDGKADYARIGDTGGWVYYGTLGDFTQEFHSYHGMTFGQPSQYQLVTGKFSGGTHVEYGRLGATKSYFYLRR